MSRPVEPPSGHQHELAWGNQRATVVEVGGALRTYTVAGLDVIDGYALDERCTGARGQSLVPWPNRLRDGRYEFDGRPHQLPLTEPGKSNAIHGLVRWANWHAAAVGGDRVVMEHLLHPSPGYPFSLALGLEYTLGAGGLTVRLDAENVGSTPLPFGAGAHPYLTLGTETIDPLVLRAPGRQWMRTDDRQIPVSTEPVEGTPYDFRSPRRIADAVLDTGYGDLEREDGRAVVEMATEDGARRVALWMDESIGWLMLFTGDTLERQDARRRGLGVEPMTCPPNAFATGDGVRVLAPGDRTVVTWGISPSGIQG